MELLTEILPLHLGNKFSDKTCDKTYELYPDVNRGAMSKPVLLHL